MKRQKGEIRVISQLLKNSERDYSIRGISLEIGMSSMGTLKILKKLENNELVSSKKIGKSLIYRLNWKNDDIEEYLIFILKEEAKNSSAYIKRWMNEIKKINLAEISIIFGSILENGEKSNDIDVLFVVKEKNFDDLREKINRVNKINEKEIHPIYQTPDDIKKNINQKNKIILDAIKGVIVLGHREYINLIKNI